MREAGARRARPAVHVATTSQPGPHPRAIRLAGLEIP